MFQISEVVTLFPIDLMHFQLVMASHLPYLVDEAYLQSDQSPLPVVVAALLVGQALTVHVPGRASFCREYFQVVVEAETAASGRVEESVA